MLLLLIVLCILIVALGFFYFTLLFTLFYDAPYIRTPARDIPLIFKAAGIRPGEVFYELGSGDGRIVRTAAAQGARAFGVEKSLPLIWWSRFITYIARSARIYPRRGDTKVSHYSLPSYIQRNILDVDLSNADVIFCYLLPGIMPRLKEKFERELKSGTRVITYAFSVPGWTPIARLKPTPRKVIHVYVRQ